jgi:hypothetical protein
MIQVTSACELARLIVTMLATEARDHCKAGKDLVGQSDAETGVSGIAAELIELSFDAFGPRSKQIALPTQVEDRNQHQPDEPGRRGLVHTRQPQGFRPGLQEQRRKEKVSQHDNDYDELAHLEAEHGSARSRSAHPSDLTGVPAL